MPSRIVTWRIVTWRTGIDLGRMKPLTFIIARSGILSATICAIVSAIRIINCRDAAEKAPLAEASEDRPRIPWEKTLMER